MIPDTDPPRTLGDKAAYGLLKVDCPEICNQAFLRLIRYAGSKKTSYRPVMVNSICCPSERGRVHLMNVCYFDLLPTLV